MSTVIWWIRRDIRLHDNPALHAALESGTQVLPVFIIDPNLWEGQFFSKRRAAFLLENLHALDRQLQARGSHLILHRGAPLTQLKKLIYKENAGAIFAETDYTPYALQRDAQISQHLPLNLVGGSLLLHPDLVQKGDGAPYQVYTPFMRKWKAAIGRNEINILATPDHIPTPNDVTGIPLPPSQYEVTTTGFPAGEKEALQRLDAFTSDHTAKIFDYAQTRNRPDLNKTSQLSPYLHLGVLSPRLAIRRAMSALNAAQTTPEKDSAETWLNELIWREFFGSILYHFPEAKNKSFRLPYHQLRWQNDQADFKAWKSGCTGFPLVDAGMRQLAATGWMHNRLRMITASFLVKNLLINWQWGEAWFMQNLLDGDIAANNGGWQWVAGTGTDAAPYFRVFNPVSQSKKHDPDGEYIRRWVPELRAVPSSYIHTPWEMDIASQEKANLRLGEEYPLPIIDLAFSRQRAIDAYKLARL